MNYIIKKSILLVFILNIINLISSDISEIEPWKIDLQILLGFTDEEVDGKMGKATFESLKLFAINQDLEDVVLRGEFDDLGYWGFQQYIMKYHQYWLRELKNYKIIKDVSKNEYIKQAEETLYSFDIAIQKAQMEIERLKNVKDKSDLQSQEQKDTEIWKKEKIEVEKLITLLNKSIVIAEKESDKWNFEKIRAKRLAEEQEQLKRLDERKLEVSILISDLEESIIVAKREIDRLVEENNEMLLLIETTLDTRKLADELKKELSDVRFELDSIYSREISNELKEEVKIISFNIDSLIYVKDSLEKIIQNADLINNEVTNKPKKKWYKFW